MIDEIHRAQWAEELGAAVPQVRSDVFFPPPDTPMSPNPSQPHLSLLSLLTIHPLCLLKVTPLQDPPALLCCVSLVFIFGIFNPV